MRTVDLDEQAAGRHRLPQPSQASSAARQHAQTTPIRRPTLQKWLPSLQIHTADLVTMASRVYLSPAMVSSEIGDFAGTLSSQKPIQRVSMVSSTSPGVKPHPLFRYPG